MLIRLLFVSAFLLPLLGIVQMEAGEYGPSVGMQGYRNHATEAFLAFCLLALVSYKGLGRFLRPISNAAVDPSQVTQRYRRGLVLSAVVLGLSAAALLFLFGGLQTATGGVDRGVFRVNLGALGSLAYFLLKFLAPGILAALFMLRLDARAGVGSSALLGVCIVFAVAVALSFGFKSGIVTMMLPALLLARSRASPLVLALLLAAALAVVVGGYYLFEKLDETDLSFVLTLLETRLTTMTGDVAWLMWDLLSHGETLPGYAQTLPAVFGDRVLSLVTGVTPTSNAYEWVMLHSALIPTYLSGYSPEEIVEGHNNTATGFSEGILFAGYVGIAIFGVLSGVLARWTVHWVESALARRKVASAAVGACFAVHCVWAWFISGGINAWAHVSVAANLFLLYLVLSSLFGGRSQPANARGTLAPAPECGPVR
jgi:hypothetical protein